MHVPYGWSGTATPSKIGCTFAPLSRTYNNVTAAQPAQDYGANCGANRTLTVQGDPTTVGTVTVSPADLNGQANGTTPFTRSYANNTQVTLQAPSSAVGAAFHHWEKDGSSAGTSTTIAVTMDAAHVVKAIYATMKNISGNVGTSGATIDFGSAGPTTSDGSGNYSINVPYGWSGTATPSKGGCTFTPSSRTYSNVTTAQGAQNYTVNCGLNRTLTVQGDPTTVGTVTLTPSDLSGQSNGTTPFTRSYANNTTVTLQAPSSVVGAPFHHWEKNGASAGITTTLVVTMDADHTVKAVYATLKIISGNVGTSGERLTSGVQARPRRMGAATTRSTCPTAGRGVPRLVRAAARLRRPREATVT